MHKKYLPIILEIIIFGTLIFAVVVFSSKAITTVNQTSYLKTKCGFNYLEARAYYKKNSDEVERVYTSNLCPKYIPESSQNELERLNAITQQLEEDVNKKVNLILAQATKIAQSNIDNSIKLQKLNAMLSIIQKTSLRKDITNKISVHINSLITTLTK